MDEEDIPNEIEDDFETESNVTENETEYDQDTDDNIPDLDIDADEVLSAKDKKDGINDDEFEIESYKDEDADDTYLEDGEDDIDELNSTKKVHLFNKEVNVDYIKNTHPECLPINMNELQVMLPVIRNERGIIIDDFHTTLPVLTKYEKTRVIGQRASMIEHGANPFIEVPSHIIDSVLIAEMELNEKKIPFIIKRPLPNNGFEYWRLSDLELI
jgi:DNA-directed RNA polymerase subunit K/omega